jgi:opacity protein-like surface antigen
MRLFLFSIFTLLSLNSYAGYFGGGISHTKSESFHTQYNGIRVDFGAHVNSFIDLEWNYVDFGKSFFDDPTFVAGDTTNADPDDDDNDFTGTGFGNESNSSFIGLKKIHTQGLAGGLKFKKAVNNWLQAYARVSLLAWEAQTTQFGLYAPVEPEDDAGNSVGRADATNASPCGFDLCRTEDEKGEPHWAVDFWYGYGLIAKPFNWLAFRVEYSFTTLDAVDFPRGKMEGLNSTLEIHF